MTTIQVIQAWCVLNIGIYFFARHVFNYARTGESFLKSILEAPEMINNDPMVIGFLKDVNIPPFGQMIAYENLSTNLVLASLIFSAIALFVLPFVGSGVLFYVIIFLLVSINFNTLVIAAQLMHKRMVIKKVCNHYYNIVESYRLNKERDKEMAEAFQNFSNRLQELLNNPDKDKDGSDE